MDAPRRRPAANQCVPRPAPPAAPPSSPARAPGDCQTRNNTLLWYSRYAGNENGYTSSNGCLAVILENKMNVKTGERLGSAGAAPALHPCCQLASPVFGRSQRLCAALARRPARPQRRSARQRSAPSTLPCRRSAHV